MTLQRFSLRTVCSIAILAMSLGGVMADEPLAMIDQQMIDQQAIGLDEYSPLQLPTVDEDWSRFVRPSSPWHGDIDFVALERPDAITFVDPFDPSQRSTLETGGHQGFRLRLNHDRGSDNESLDMAASEPIFHFSVLRTQGDGEVVFWNDRILAEASLTSVAFAMGNRERVLGGERRVMLGGHWINLQDSYQLERFTLVPLHDWIITKNSLLTLDAHFNQHFQWHKFSFSTGFCAGVGMNQSMRSRRVNFGAPPVEVEEIDVTYQLQANADAGFRLTPHSGLHVSLTAFSIGDVYIARDVAAGRNEPDQLEMYGVTLGYRYQF